MQSHKPNITVLLSLGNRQRTFDEHNFRLPGVAGVTEAESHEFLIRLPRTVTELPILSHGRQVRID